jgi:hypothetical protein
MSALFKLHQSRESWKEKATKRGAESREQRKTIHRQNRIIQKNKAEIKELKDQFSKKKELVLSDRVRLSKADIVFLALNFFVISRISLRAISRVLGVLSGFHLLQFRPPCPQTISNWVNKLSLSRLKDIPPFIKSISENTIFTNGWMYLIDESIGHASGKILLVLRVRADHYNVKPSFPNMTDMQVVAVGVSASWTGEFIADFLQEIIEVCGRPTAYILDGGSNLNKATHVLHKRGIGSLTIRDISHYAANLLKKKYGHHSDLESFLSICGECSKNFKQSILACLTPPKVRTKARFMNLHRLVRWAKRILSLSPVGRARSGSMLEKLRHFLLDLPKYKLFIENFLNDANIVLQCQEVIKTQGLTWESKEKCESFIELLSDNDPIKEGITQWLDDHIRIAQDLGLPDIGMLASTDGIESTFGLSKSHGVSTIKDPVKMAIKIAAICGVVSQDDVDKVLKTPHQILTSTIPKHSLQSDRRAIFSGKKSIEDINNIIDAPYFSLIPKSKKWEKSPIITINTGCNQNSNGPPFSTAECLL